MNRAGFLMKYYELRWGWKNLTLLFVLVALLVLSAYHFLDLKLAALVLGVIGPMILLSHQVSNVPSLLLEIVCAVTVLSWAGYVFFERKITSLKKPGLFELVGCTAPLSFFLKDVLKYLFGRTNPRLWLVNPESYGLHWFQGGGDYTAFPSGHMAVFTVLVLAVCRFHPRLGHACMGFLVLLAAALIATEYHFLSDVIAGVYLGLMVDILTYRTLSLAHHLPGKGGPA